jgi:type III pantothenate kinase
MLLVDVGNTRLKWCVAGPEGLGEVRSAAHDGAPASCLARAGLPRIETAWVAHVMKPAEEAAIAAAVREHAGVAPGFARTHKEFMRLRVAYEDPARLGVDRWLTMLGLWQQGASAFCVAGAGTALTFDAVDDHGHHLGGLIAPGLATAQAAIAGATRFEIRPGARTYEEGLGRDTEGCVRQGALHACVGLIERAVRGLPGGRFLTGGDAPALVPHLGREWQERPNAVLEGLLAFALSGLP